MMRARFARGQPTQQEGRPRYDAAMLRYRAGLVEVEADAVIAPDAEFRVTVWNPAAERLFGYTAEEA